MRPIALAAAFLVLVGCNGSPTATPTALATPGTTATPAATASPVATASPHGSPGVGFPTPTPQGSKLPSPALVTCASQIPAGHQLALGILGKTHPIVVRDITDIAHPVTRCTINGGGFHRFVDATDVSYIVTGGEGQGALYVADLKNSSNRLVRAWTNEGSLYWVYAWGPDGTTLTYLSSFNDKVAWHLLSAAGDVTLSDLGSVPGRGVDRNNDDAMVGFSADGKYVALENTFSNAAGAARPFQVVRLSDHKLVYSRTDGTMATWGRTGATFYFRTNAGVESWDPTAGLKTVVFQSFRWIHPWPSADGKRIAYVDVDQAGYHYPGYVQPSAGQAFRVASRPRTGAAFLNSRLMWYQEEAACSGPTVCGLGEPRLTGRTFIYDVVTRTESVSVISALFDSWPHSI